jgi:hypothetical protein
VRRGSGWDEAKEVGEEMGMVSAAGGFWCGRWWSIIASDRGHRRCEGGVSTPATTQYYKIPID